MQRPIQSYLSSYIDAVSDEHDAGWLTQWIKHSRNECQKSPSNMCPCSTKAVINYICSDRQQYIVWVKIIYFSFMPKIIKIMFHEDI